MEATFDVTTYQFEGSHIRHYPGGLAHEHECSPKIHVKRYTLKSNPRPCIGDPSFIVFPANGCHKELYEPLLIDLAAAADASDLKIRAFWTADSAYLGESAVLNADILGDDPHWFDHSRDMMLLMHHFRSEMPQPLIGIGHSMGGDQLAYLSSIHPRLFSHLLLLDPSSSPAWSNRLPSIIQSIMGRPDSYESLLA